MSVPLFVVRALDTLAGEDGVFRLLAVDQRHSFRSVIEGNDPAAVSDERLSQVKRDVVAALSPYCTGVLLDPEYVAADVVHSGELNGATGMIVTAESDGYEAVSKGLPARFIPDWRVERTRELGGLAVKILIQYLPGNPAVTEKDKEFAYGVFEQCRRFELACVLEVLVGETAGAGPEDTAAAMIEAAEALSPASDLYKTPFPAPGNADADERASWCQSFDEACAVPWVVLSAGADWDLFRQQLTAASKAGASGFLAGRSIWKDSVVFSTQEQRMEHLREVSVPRLREINDLVGTVARSWRMRQAHALEQSAPVPAWVRADVQRSGGST